MRRVRVLFSIPNFVTAGSQLVLLDLLRRLDRERIEPLVCVLKRGGLDVEVERLGIPLLCKPFVVSMAPRVSLLARAWWASRRFRPLRIHVWHSWHYTDDYSEPLIARLAGARWLYTKKNMSWGGRGWHLRSRLAHRIAVNNPEMVERFFAHPAYRHKVAVIPQGVDVERFRRVEGGRQHDLLAALPAEAPVVGSVANLVPVKDHPTLLRAVARAGSRPQLLLVGRGGSDYERSLRRQAEELGIAKRVQFAGLIANEELPALLSGLDLFVLSSRAEGLPVSLLEAMACERACVATRCGGAEAVITDGEDGLLVEIGDDGAMAERIDRLAADRDLRRRMGERARARVVAGFSAERQAEQYQQLYEEMAGMGSN